MGPYFDAAAVEQVAMGDLLRADPDLAGAAEMLPSVVFSQVITDYVISQGVPRILVVPNQKSNSVVVMAIVVLEDGVGHAAVQIKPASVRIASGAVRIGFAELDRDPVRSIRPDSHRPILAAAFGASILIRRTVVNQSAVGIIN